LEIGGYLDCAAGFALGQFTDCSRGRYHVDVECVLRERLSHLRPTLANLNFGHALPNRPLTLGTDALLDAELGCLTTPLGPR
jgi:muramoyltetrapeptide carboxypeptidase